MKRAFLASGLAAFVWISGQSELPAQGPGSRLSRMVQGIGPSGGVIPSGVPNERSAAASRAPSSRSIPNRSTPTAGRTVANPAPVSPGDTSAAAESADSAPWYKRLNPFAKSPPAAEVEQAAPVTHSSAPLVERTARTNSPGKTSRRARGSLGDDQPGTLFGFDQVRHTAEQQVDQQLDRAERLREVAERNGNEQLKATAERMEERAESQYAERVGRFEEKRTRFAEQAQPTAQKVDAYADEIEQYVQSPVLVAGPDAAPREERLPSRSLSRFANRPNPGAGDAPPAPDTNQPNSAEVIGFPPRPRDVAAEDAASADTEGAPVADGPSLRRPARASESARDPVEIDFSRSRPNRGQFDREFSPRDDAETNVDAPPRPTRSRRDVDRVNVEEPADSGGVRGANGVERANGPSAEESPTEPTKPADEANPRSWRQKWKSWFTGKE